MRLRLLGVLGLIFTLGCMCGEMDAFNEGMDQALVENFSELEAKVLAVPPGKNRRRVLELCSRGQADAAAGRLELVAASVWMGEAEVALSDGDISAEEAAALTDSYDAMVSQ